MFFYQCKVKGKYVSENIAGFYPDSQKSQFTKHLEDSAGSRCNMEPYIIIMIKLYKIKQRFVL